MAEASASGSYEELLQTTMERQGRLQQLARSKSRTGAERGEGMEALRTSLREGYEQIILGSPALAHQHGVDHHLWKHCFYAPVEAFRLRMRAAARAAQKATKKRSGGAENGTHGVDEGGGAGNTLVGPHN